ncbi:MAG: type II CAAX prenyl endopeptidase Rce1 family protein [Streptococcus thermophilus]
MDFALGWLLIRKTAAASAALGSFVSIPYAHQPCPPLPLYIGMGLALSMVYQKRENLSASITLHVLWNLYTLGATILVMTNPM